MEPSFVLTVGKSGDVPYCFMKRTTLFAKVCLLDASAAISPYNGCVAVPLSEKDLRSGEQRYRHHLPYLKSHQPPILTKTLRSCLIDLRFAVS